MIRKTSYSEKHRNKEKTSLNLEPQLATKGAAPPAEGNPSSTLFIIQLIPGLHLNKSTISPLLVLFASKFWVVQQQLV